MARAVGTRMKVPILQAAYLHTLALSCLTDTKTVTTRFAHRLLRLKTDSLQDRLLIEELIKSVKDTHL